MTAINSAYGGVLGAQNKTYLQWSNNLAKELDLCERTVLLGCRAFLPMTEVAAAAWFGCESHDHIPGNEKVEPSTEKKWFLFTSVSNVLSIERLFTCYEKFHMVCYSRHTSVCVCVCVLSLIHI